MHIQLTKPEGTVARRVKIDCGGRRQAMLILSPENRAENAPGVLWIHGGGYITGMKEMVYMSRAVDLVTQFGAVVVSPDYWLAPRIHIPQLLTTAMRRFCG